MQEINHHPFQPPWLNPDKCFRNLQPPSGIQIEQHVGNDPSGTSKQHWRPHKQSTHVNSFNWLSPHYTPLKYTHTGELRCILRNIPQVFLLGHKENRGWRSPSRWNWGILFLKNIVERVPYQLIHKVESVGIDVYADTCYILSNAIDTRVGLCSISIYLL